MSVLSVDAIALSELDITIAKSIKSTEKSLNVFTQTLDA